MRKDGREPDRRGFLKLLGGAAVAAAACGRKKASAWAPAPAPGIAPGRARVVIVRAKRTLTSGYDADRGALRAMLASGLTALTGARDGAAALKHFFRPGETVGLKVNGLAGRQAATHVELVDELSALLGHGDIDGAHQIVFDRHGSDLTSSGFTLNQGGQGYRCAGNEWLGYEEEPTLMPSSASCLARILTERVDGVVALPILKQHMLSGMTGALKNQFGFINNPNKMHVDQCDPYIAEVNALAKVRSKLRLFIMDALRPVVDNGPSYQPGMGAEANALLFGVDPVAMDVVALELLEELRRGRGIAPLDRVGLAPGHIASAARMGLGVGERARIDVVTLEV